MAFKIVSNCAEWTSTQGTGTVTTQGSPTGMMSFNTGIATTNTFPYHIKSGDGVSWESGIGTVTVSAGVTTVARTLVLESFAAGVYGASAISLVGTSIIFCAVLPQHVNTPLSSGSSASPTGNVSTVEKMMGLGLVSGFSITPQLTGRLLCWIGGVALNSTLAGDGTTITGRFGTGVAPSNAAAVTGTAFGLPQHFIAATTLEQAGFIVMGNITGLTLNTAVWIDLSLLAVTGGGSTVKDVQIIVFEY